MIAFAARHVYDEHNDALNHRQRLQTLFTVIITRIDAGNSDAHKRRLSVHKVNAVLNDIALALDFVKSDHNQIVDAF